MLSVVLSLAAAAIVAPPSPPAPPPKRCNAEMYAAANPAEQPPVLGGDSYQSVPITLIGGKDTGRCSFDLAGAAWQHGSRALLRD